ncbi:PAS domain-containing protein [Desulfovibrio sp. OttesenSCG-928-C14]|nr:PAS domain-containing protein [Desulfovibrio sp. OttesenSCG-928-C14]
MKSVQHKLFQCFLLVIIVSVVIPSGYMYVYLKNDLMREARLNALRQARILASFFDTIPDEHKQAVLEAGLLPRAALDTLKLSGTRLTLVAPSGRIIFDTAVENERLRELNNQIGQPEVQQALRHGVGHSLRTSLVSGEEQLYVSVLLADRAVLVMAIPHSTLDSMLAERFSGFMFSILWAVFLALVLAMFFSRRFKLMVADLTQVVSGIADGKYNKRLKAVPGSEFQPLADSVNSLARELEAQLARSAERKERLQAVLDSVPDGVLVLDGAGKIRSFNPALQAMIPEFRASHGQSLERILRSVEVGQGVRDILSGRKAFLDSSSESYPHFPENSALNDGTQEEDEGPLAHYPTEVVQLEMPGERFYLVHMVGAGAAAARLARDATFMAEGEESAGPGQRRRFGRNLVKDLGAVLVFTDVSPVIRMERDRRDFVANVSHELRTPLTAIQGYAETIVELVEAEGGKPGEPSGGGISNMARFARIIQRQSARLARLVEDLLAFSRLENIGRVNPDEEASARAVLDETMLMCQTKARQKGVRVSFAGVDEVKVRISPDYLLQVFLNLVDNALRFSPERGTVRIEAEKHEDGYRFSVEDQGPGVPEEEREKIFERFYKLRYTRQEAGGQGGAGGSTGLGLAICRHIVELYGGAAGVGEGRGGKGARFWFTLPSAEAGEGRDEAEEESRAS